MVDVFLSYKSEDKRYAKALAEALARRGLDVWWDVDLLPGDRFTQEIDAVIKQAKAAVVLWSARSVASPYVRDEATLARDRGILVPARLDDAELPLGFRAIQTLDLAAWNADARSPDLDPLVRAVAARCGSEIPARDSGDDLAEGHMHSGDEQARLWAAISQRQPPSLSEHRFFLQQYPTGLFSELARLRVAELDRPKRTEPMKLVAGATAIVVLIGGIFGLIVKWPEVSDVLGLHREEPERPANAQEPEPEPVARAPSESRSANAVPPVQTPPSDRLNEAPPRASERFADGAAAVLETYRPAPDDADAAVTVGAGDVGGTRADGSPCPFCPEMVTLPAGTFDMGSDFGPDLEKPRRTMVIDRPFAIGATEVSVGQWNACASRGPCEARPGNDDVPVTSVTWDDVQTYLDWLSGVTGQDYRLPTETEWEYAAKGGRAQRYPTGAVLLADDATYDAASGGPTPVASYKANPFGVHDLAGNVWEWVADCAAPYSTSADEVAEGNDTCLGVLRGGGWKSAPSELTSANRFFYPRGQARDDLGFRVALDVTP